MENFKNLNPDVKILKEGNKIVISNLWSEKDFQCVIRDKDRKIIKNIYLPKTLSAIYHKDKKILEFIFAPLPSNYDVLNVKFTFSFVRKNFNCYFAKASDVVRLLATAINIFNDSDTDFRNLIKFNFYFDKEKFLYKKGIKPYSFFVEGDFDNINEQFFVSLSKHINFYTHFFYRKFPHIQIHDQTIENRPSIIEPSSNIEDFPKEIGARELNQILLDIFLVANNTTNIRLKYIFYYQILEYSAYYYLKDNTKNKLNNLLKNPDIVENFNDYSNKIIELLKDSFSNNNKDDLVTLKNLINDNCSCDDIKDGLVLNKKYFIEDIYFKGGFQLKAICKDDIHIDSSVMNAVIENLNKIRNVLVHLREKRENKVILPNRENDEKIKPYLFLLRRLAEKIIINIGNTNKE